MYIYILLRTFKTLLYIISDMSKDSKSVKVYIGNQTAKVKVVVAFSEIRTQWSSKAFVLFLALDDSQCVVMSFFIFQMVLCVCELFK